MKNSEKGASRWKSSLKLQIAPAGANSETSVCNLLKDCRFLLRTRGRNLMVFETAAIWNFARIFQISEGQIADSKLKAPRVWMATFVP